MSHRGRTLVNHEARLEDLEFMDAHGETATGAARRLDLTRSGLWKWCKEHNQRDLFHRLAAREVDHQPNQHTKENQAA